MRATWGLTHLRLVRPPPAAFPARGPPSAWADPLRPHYHRHCGFQPQLTVEASKYVLETGDQQRVAGEPARATRGPVAGAPGPGPFRFGHRRMPARL